MGLSDRVLDTNMMVNMRVTFILGYAGMAGGVRVLAIYADGLRRRGHEVTVVSTPHVTVNVRFCREWCEPNAVYFSVVGRCRLMSL